MELLPIIFIAFLVAVLFSMLGLGGAIIYTPLFFWLGIPLLTAIPMALLLNTITTASASMTYLKLRLVDKRVAFPIIFTSIIGAFTGSYLAHRVDTEVIIFLLSLILLLASIRLLFFNSIGFPTGTLDRKTPYLNTGFIGAGAGLLIGVVSSLVGIGGGTFVVPLLLILGFKTKNAVATSAFIITFMSLSGFLGHLNFGRQQLDAKLLFYAGAAAFIGAQAGSRVMFRRASPRTIELMFAVVLLFMAGKLLYGLM
ncbi:MAG: sulfite exporter TauE/SafE family protein [Candidatus Methanoperedens sp.]|nr:sulfite exporter TauE/SafE family protein [Candidatus Methanoperedens sp.]